MLNNIYKFQKGGIRNALFVWFKSSLRMLLLLLIFSSLKHLVVKFKWFIHSLWLFLSLQKKGGGGLWHLIMICMQIINKRKQIEPY